VVLLLIIAFEIFRRYKMKKEGKSFSESLKSMLKLQPRTASAEERSRLEHMREKFEEGIEKFRSAGRSVYDVPWFVLIGEPGSGKTEAIRRSNIAFPPGLQDRFQGAGGTVNMDWWFTNDAVIIDTAGRIIVEEVAAGEVAEWDQLLTMLKSQRKKCPINGVVMMLPAAAPPVEPGQQPATGGLLDDTPDQIEQRATRFVERLGRLQQRLGVRFPVFIVVTMCDRVLGFREFFDDLTDVEQQHQMLGWSNPAPLDEPYNPGAIEQALAGISDRLRKRRLELLRDPVHTEDAHKRRADQIDKLYAFPEAFDSLEPNLRAYLDRLFTKTAWYQPPFLRGVFFTSSMQKGAAIDNALAELVGAEDADAVSGGGVFRADRAYFLKDVIEKKVFQEKGLVTDAADAEGARRKARTIMWIAGGAAAALLLTSMIWGVLCSWNWQKANLDPWRNARNTYFYPEGQQGAGEFKPNTALLVDLDPSVETVIAYNANPGGDEAEGGGTVQIQRGLINRLDTAEAGFMCRLFGSSFDADTSWAQAMLLARVASRPTTSFALDQMSGVADEEDAAPAGDLESEARALAELLRWTTLALGEEPKAVVDAREVGARPLNAPDPEAVAFAPVAQVVRVRDEEAEQWAADAPRFAEVFESTAQRLRTEGEERYREWLAFSIGMSGAEADVDERRAALAAATERIVNRFRTSQADTSTFGSLTALRDAVDRFRSAERALWSMGADGAGPMDEEAADRARRLWLERYDDMREQHEQVQELLPRLREASGEAGLSPEFVRDVVQRRRRTALASFTSMLDALPPEPAPDAPPEPESDRAWLETLRSRIALQQADFADAFERRAQAIEADADDWTEHVKALDAEGAYAVARRFDAYSLAHDRLVAGGQLEGEVFVTTLSSTLDADAADAAARLRLANEALEPVIGAESEQIRQSADNARGSLAYALDLAAALRRQEAVVQALSGAFPGPDAISASFADAPRTFPAPRLSRLSPEGGETPIRPEFSVEAGRAIAGAYAIAQSGLAQSEGSTDSLLNPDEARQALVNMQPRMRAWLDEYAAYWEQILLDATAITDFTTWAAFRENGVASIAPFDAKLELDEVRQAIDAAIEPLLVLPETERGPNVSRLLSRINAAKEVERAILAQFPLDRQLGLVRTYLSALPPDTLQARDRFLADLRAGRSDLFQFLKQANQNLVGREYLFETRYAIQILVAAVAALRTDAYGSLADQYNAFVQANQGVFPFDVPAAGVEQYANFPSVDPASLGDFGAVESLAGAPQSADGAGAMIDYPRSLRSAVAELDDLLGPQERERAERLLALKHALTGPQRENVDLTCQIVILSQENIDRLPFNVSYLRVQEPGQTNDPRTLRPLEPTEFPNRRINAPLRVNAAQPLTLELLRTETDRDAMRTIELGAWSPLKMLFAFDARPAAQPFGQAPVGAAWDIRIPVGGGEAALQLVFSRPLPPLDEWPRF